MYYTIIFLTSRKHHIHVHVDIIICNFGVLKFFRYMCMHVSVHLNSLSLEESNVEERGIKVDKLEEIHLEGEVIFILSLSTMQFYSKENKST